MLFHFTITFPEETETDAESFSDDLEENGLGNYTTEVKDVVDKNRKFAVRKPTTAIAHRNIKESP